MLLKLSGDEAGRRRADSKAVTKEYFADKAGYRGARESERGSRSFAKNPVRDQGCYKSMAIFDNPPRASSDLKARHTTCPATNH